MNSQISFRCEKAGQSCPLYNAHVLINKIVPPASVPGISKDGIIKTLSLHIAFALFRVLSERSLLILPLDLLLWRAG